MSEDQAEKDVYDWFEIDNGKGKDVPGWAKRAAVHSESGLVYIPAALGGMEDKVLMCALFDGMSAVANEGHVYLPTAWMEQEFPDLAPICEKTRNYIRTFIDVLD